MLAFVLFATSVFAATPPMWGRLEPGPFATGYRLIDRYDYTRPYWNARDIDGKARTFERARPMRISVWYPALKSDAPFMTLGDYIDLMGAEERIVPIGEQQKQAGHRAFYGFPVLRAATPEQRTRLEAHATFAQRDAAPAPGKFPLILYSLGSAAIGNVMPEYLASHGYVVMQMPRLGEFAGMPQDHPFDTETKVQDTEFMLQAAHEIPSADLSSIGAIGFSAGGRWALSEAMRLPDLKAVVSLDSVMLFNDAAAKDWRSYRFYDLNAVHVPVLHMIRRAWVPQQDASMWDRMRYADRTMLVFEDAKLEHLAFQSVGYAMTLAGMRPEIAENVSEAFHWIHPLTLAFLDAHLKDNAEARRLLGSPLPPSITSSHAAAAARGPQLADIMNAVAEGALDSALRAATTGGVKPPEEVLNLAGYNLLGNGQLKEAIRVFQFNVDAHPDSANAYDSLADAYVATGDRAKAAELARKAKTLLEADSTTPSERKELIRQSIEQKLQ